MAIYIPARSDDGGWDSDYDSTQAHFRKWSETAHQMLYCMLLDQKFEYAEDHMDHMRATLGVIALSELYGLREAIATRVEADILAWDDYPKDMSDNSGFYMRFFQLLRSKTLFTRSLGHLLARQCTHSYYHGCRNGIVMRTDLIHTTHRDLKLFVLEKRDVILPIAANLLTELQELTLYSEKHISRKGELF